MRDKPRPKSHDSTGGTLKAFQRRGEVIKPAELIEVRGGEKITLAARRIYNQLLSNAFGPEMAAEGREYRIPFAELRGNHTSNDRVTEAILSLMQTVVRVRMSDGSTRNVHLLGPTDIEKFGPGIATVLTYELHPKLLPILRDSRIFARLEMQILRGFGTKYGMALYEIIAKRIGLKHIFYHDFETDELRDYLGVPVGKLGPFAALRRKAIEPAVVEVNALAPFSCRVDVVETKGRKVTKLRLSWWTKTVEERKAQWQAQQDKQRDLFDVDLPEMELWEPS
ncbi:replication initiation protein [Paracoccus sp. MC1862]|uniref:replication initiation protein n=1 Tax=Paracoccus sp. MC1862 TaxID=2760307 RepID=UPI0016019A77|nr:replication initiation protein [Paracoccus sp. MC1862]MBB1498935.1 replication initiation protein [Paracoccus sp. MC1862]QQO46731.1 replication initiation protein [Paracoccus sp. MC1862]